jgi:hypothetical protein
LQKNVRDAAREMAPNQPAVSQKLRDALTEMDESDLDNHVQRTADWLRSGIDPNSNGTENEIAQGLAKLSQQLNQAQSAMGQGKPGQRGTAQGDESAALDQVARLRSQLEALGGPQNGNNGQPGQAGNAQNGPQRNGQNGQPGGQQPGNGGSQSRNGQGQPGSNAQNGQQPGNGGALSRSGQPGNGQPGGYNGQARGNPGDRGGVSGDTRAGGGGANGTVWGNYDTGDNTPRLRGQSQPAPNDASGNPADTERAITQGMRELNQLRQMIHDDPQAAKDVADLTRQMQHLDPSRFPGNPAMVEQMQQEVLSAVDKLELELQRDGGSAEARTGKPDTVPAGYEDSVAEYYRQLSKHQ